MAKKARRFGSVSTRPFKNEVKTKNPARNPPAAAGGFTTDSFTNNVPTWERVLVPALSGRPNLRGLELGPYEGRSAVWTLEHLLNGPGCHLTCVDNFTGLAPASYRAGRTTGAHIKRALLANLKPFGPAATVVESSAEAFLRGVSEPAPTYDMIFIDLDGNGRNYLEYAVLCWPYLKPQGYLVFDNYTNSRYHDQSCPRRGIDCFLDMYAHELKLRFAGWNAIMQKRSHPLRVRRPCRSEYYHEDLDKI